MVSNQNITVAKMINFNQPVYIPRSFMDELNTEKNPKVLLLYTTSQMVLRVIPTQFSVVKIRINLTELTDDFVDQIVIALSETAVKLLYSTGICFLDDKADNNSECFYECFLENPDRRPSDQSGYTLDQVIQRIREINGIKNIEFEKIE